MGQIQAKGLQFNAEEIALILSHGPWPPVFTPDASNRLSGNKLVIRFGKILFFDVRLSVNGKIACSSCHDPIISFTDGRSVGHGLVKLTRNTPTVLNAFLNNWYGWDGAKDSLWAASLRPIIAKTEMGQTPGKVKSLLANDAKLANLFTQATGKSPGKLTAEKTLVLVGKALAAYQETLSTPASTFDRLRLALEKGDKLAINSYPDAAKRGARIFFGRGQCNVCHYGPTFSNGEFASIGRPFFLAKGKVDKGRYGGILAVKASPFNLLGKHNDDPASKSGILTRNVKLLPRNWGEFKVPSLRNVAKTAPYMHDGSLATLNDAVRHYSELNEDRLHTDGEAFLRALHLYERQIDDLVAFLKTL